MSSDDNELWVTVGANDLKEFGQVMRKITETNVFPYMLAADGFTKKGDNLYEKGDNQLIRIFQQNEIWQYQNLKNTNDRGSLVQFIANRLHTPTPAIAKEPAQLIVAGKIAKAYYRDYIKSLRSGYLVRLLQERNNCTTKGRRP